MSKIIKKIMNANQEYTVLGGGSEWETHEVITQAAYDQLTPAQQAEKVYMIKESGTPVPTSGEISSLINFIKHTPIVTITANWDYDIPANATLVKFIQEYAWYNKYEISIIPIADIIEWKVFMPNDAVTYVSYNSTTQKLHFEFRYNSSAELY